MLEELHIQNYRSFVDAKAKFSPFTIVTGKNGSGKSNLLRLIECLGEEPTIHRAVHTEDRKTLNILPLQKHSNHVDKEQRIKVTADGETFELIEGKTVDEITITNQTALFNLVPETISQQEAVRADIKVSPTGEGAVAVIDSLKTGDREDLFDQIESQLTSVITSIEKLSLKHGKQGKKLIQVREKGLKHPLPVSELSEGTRLLLLVLTIVYQESPPSVICLEDIDRGLHPRLFQDLVRHLTKLCQTEGIQIIATTHNPYLIDQFVDDEASVLIVEKENGESTITSLADRLQEGDLGEEEGALGSLWFGGFFDKSN